MTISNNPILQTRLPINFYVWVIISLLVPIVFLINGMPLSSSLLYFALIAFLVYVSISRYACNIMVCKEFIEISYAPLGIKEKYDLTKIDRLDYKKGYYDFTSKKEWAGNRFAANIPNDGIILIKGNEEYVIKVNCRFGDFKKAYVVIQAIVAENKRKKKKK
ncbi:MAG: hypothetical protein N4A71_13900 [Carboxylicivirga sp.]|nr:hypothetical protein [Carboxylicivirga sp.]MCT4647899.1 hypothetical protein [Carboxylicivirga sp.]